ncbi:MAG: nucleotide sugar dehydrogenase [Candidatus Levybacteria bacterium]|nr:nucleotide sugar dehydrogenase [Candidatus Levybacteria bacterium]
MNYKSELVKKINDKSAKVGIVGMGYVGMPLAELSSGAGFKTVGFVRNPQKATKINDLKIKNLTSTIDKTKMSEADVVLVCVQTPVFKNKMPDLRALKGACTEVSEHLRAGQLVVIESSIAPGTTRKIALPILEKTGLKAGTEFFLAFSPERVDPGNSKFKLNEIPKVVSGLEENSFEAVVSFYEKIIDKVVPVSSLETAELTKIFENTFRLINISLVNQVHQYAKAIDVDMWEVIDAAATKPFGFLAHYPGPGIGGHCIPVDPYYLIEDAKNLGIDLTLVKEAGRINENQPQKVVKRAAEIISASVKKTNPQNGIHSVFSRLIDGVHLKDSNNKKKVLLIGVAYKPDIDDHRESPAHRIWELFQKSGYEVSYHDPYIPEFMGENSVELNEKTIDGSDLLVITTNHSSVDYEWLSSFNKPILDTRKVKISDHNSHVFSL